MALAICIAGAGYFAVTHALANALQKGAVELAHGLAPSDGPIAARLAEKLSSAPGASRQDRTRADKLARDALRQDPTAIAAVSALGINAQVRGDVASARRLFAYSQLLSRRNLVTQLWAIEDTVGRGDVAGALQHYDIALRTSPSTSDILFPVLASAISEPQVRAALAKTLANRPAWSTDFIDYVAGNGNDPRATVSLFHQLQHDRIAISATARSSLVARLLSARFFDDAWAYYASLHPGVDRRSSRDPRFTGSGDHPSPFDWTPINDGSVSTSIQRGDKDGIFDFSVPSSVDGTMLQQLQILPPGNYLIEGHSSGIDQPDASRPYWALTCLDGRELGSVDIPNSAQGNGMFAGRFSVPGNCPVQTLYLKARASDQVSGVVGQLDRAWLRPAP